MSRDLDPLDKSTLETLYFGSSQMLNEHGSAPHVFAFGSEDLDMFVFSQAEFDDEARARFVTFARHFVRVKKVHTVYTIVEAWHVEMPPGTPMNERKKVIPHKHKDRNEVLHCSIQKADGREWVANILLTRRNGVPSVPDTLPENSIWPVKTPQAWFNFFGEVPAT